MTTRAELPPINVVDREQRVRARLMDFDADAVVVTSPTNIRWLTGFAGSNGTVVVTSTDLVLFTDSRYADRAPQEIAQAASSGTVVIARETLGDAIQDVLGSTERVAFEADHVTWSEHHKIDQEWLPAQTLVPTVALLDELRARKDHAEIARIELAAQIVDAALLSVVPMLLDHPTERAFARALEAAIRDGGADDIGFDTIVASGPNGAIPHHTPGERQIEHGDMVIIDVGGKIDGYRSDMTRTFCIGEMTAEQQLHYDTVINAQQAGVQAMVAHAGTKLVDEAARAVIDQAGWAESFTHGTGHGVGLDIHELPRVARGVSDQYEIGTVATVEPGVYLRGIAGVRIEDTCVVTEAGALRLTRFPKDVASVTRQP